MICYRDMTFCSFWEDCKNDKCRRALTDTVREAAKNFGLPICQFTDKPDCWKKKGSEG